MKDQLKAGLIGFIIGILSNSPVSAFQTLPTISTNQAATCSIEFDQDAATLADAQAFHYESINDGAATPVVIPVTCSGTSSPFSCLTPLPVKSVGTHSVAITAAEVLSDGTFLTSTVSATFNYRVANPPNAPKNLHIKK